ncbi:unnamed protein product [Pedinophyceae sp. YPF-701]|nr:unnamed protein product [Pedinophyceae sp. YPF-701]
MSDDGLKALVTRLAAAWKRAEAGDKVEGKRCEDILRSISMHEVTAKDLVETGCAKLTRVIAASKNAELAALAQKLSTSWVAHIRKSKAQPKPKQQTAPQRTAPPSSASPPARPAGRGASIEGREHKQVRSATAPQQKAKEDATSAQRRAAEALEFAHKVQEHVTFTGNGTRDMARTAMAKAFASHGSGRRSAPEKVAEVVDEMEAGLFDMAGSTGASEYQVRYRALLQAIKQNDDLRQHVLDGSVGARHLAALPAADLMPAKVKQRLEAVKKERLEAIMQVEDEGAATDMFVCPRCKSRNCVYKQKEARPARWPAFSDEAAPAFVTCRDCAHRWVDD